MRFCRPYSYGRTAVARARYLPGERAIETRVITPNIGYVTR